jgi:replicative DNA helicase
MKSTIPPQSLDAEKALLGLLILIPEGISDVLITPEMFYNPLHQEIFKIMMDMYLKNELIDIITLSDKLTNQGIDSDYLNQLTDIDTTANIEQLSEIIQTKYTSRELIRYGMEMTKKAYTDDPMNIISELQQRLASLSGVKSSNTHHISESLRKLHEVIEKNYKGNFELTGLPTGFTLFDRLSSGLQKSDLIVIAGESSQGKTSLALNILSNVALFGHKAAIYSYEMNEIQLTARLVSSISEVSSSNIQYKKLEDNDFMSVEKAINELIDKNIFIDDVPTTSFEYLEKSIRAMVLKQEIELVVIDYLQLIQTKGNNKAEGTANIANGLKGLAKTLNIPIILLSQLARDRANPKPTMGRLKNSGDIENAADIVWLIFRPEYYGIGEIECAGRTYSPEGLAHMMIVKGRNIGTFEFVTRFKKELTKFEDYHEEPKEAHYVPY